LAASCSAEDLEALSALKKEEEIASLHGLSLSFYNTFILLVLSYKP
jgi:hypothetical protein